LLPSLAAVSYFLGEVCTAAMIATMVMPAITTAFIQDDRSNEAAARVRAMAYTTSRRLRALRQSMKARARRELT
jgi:Mg2+-importing ATPase